MSTRVAQRAVTASVLLHVSAAALVRCARVGRVLLGWGCMNNQNTMTGCSAVQNGQRQEDVQSTAAQARDGIDGTSDQFQAKAAEVQQIESEINTVEKALQAAQGEVDELTQRQAQLDIDIKEFQANEHNSETDKVRACVPLIAPTAET